MRWRQPENHVLMERVRSFEVLSNSPAEAIRCHAGRPQDDGSRRNRWATRRQQMVIQNKDNKQDFGWDELSRPGICFTIKPRFEIAHESYDCKCASQKQMREADNLQVIKSQVCDTRSSIGRVWRDDLVVIAWLEHNFTFQSRDSGVSSCLPFSPRGNQYSRGVTPAGYCRYAYKYPVIRAVAAP